MKSNNLTIIGMQWGDEGKGKVVDHFSRQADLAVRFGGALTPAILSLPIKGNLFCTYYPLESFIPACDVLSAAALSAILPG